MKERRLVYGVGVNDAPYPVKPKNSSNTSGDCPFYERWKGMLARCYSKAIHNKKPTYIGCTVAKEWESFMTFRAWMETQDWVGKQLDKDILLQGNKVYSPETCVFVDRKLNLFITDRVNKRGDFPIGVSKIGNGKF